MQLPSKPMPSAKARLQLARDDPQNDFMRPSTSGEPEAHEMGVAALDGFQDEVLLWGSRSSDDPFSLEPPLYSPVFRLRFAEGRW